jgi:xanthine dehydrogenase YagS FAD-binding subunit
MNPFRYERTRDASSAVTRLTGAPNGVFLAGGTNLVDHLKLGVRQPDLLVDISHLPYDRIEPLPGGGVRIGAMVRNSDLAADRTIRNRYPLLAQALSLPGNAFKVPLARNTLVQTLLDLTTEKGERR